MSPEKSFFIRQAATADLPEILSLFGELTKHLQQIGTERPEDDGPHGARARYVTAAVREDMDKAAALVAVSVMELSIIGVVVVNLQRPCGSVERDAGPWSAIISNIIVTTDWRNQTIGRSLMQAAHDWALDHHAIQVGLSVSEHNTAALRFYQSLGYASHARWMVARLDSASAERV